MSPEIDKRLKGKLDSVACDEFVGLSCDSQFQRVWNESFTIVSVQI